MARPAARTSRLDAQCKVVQNPESAERKVTLLVMNGRVIDKVITRA